jgi:hypothetical protein
MGEPIDQPSTTRNNARKLIRDLWNFVENVTDDDPARTCKFFALRERVRNHYASLPRSRSRRSQALAFNVKTEPLEDVVFTLQYCLETFEQTCQCGHCDPCTKGKRDITRSIRTIEDLQLERRKLEARGAFSHPLT